MPKSSRSSSAPHFMIASSVSCRFARIAIALTLAAAAVCARGDEDRDVERLARRADKLASTIESIQVNEKFRIPATIMREAKGIIVLRQYEAGFVFGAKGGYGIALVKDEDGKWGPPAWIKTGEISGGLQVGVQSLRVVFVIMTDNGLNMLKKTRFRIGVDASVTMGPTSANAQVKSGAYSALLAYTDTEGLYAGATFEGGFLLPDNKSNGLTYDQDLSVQEILYNRELVLPSYADRVVALLRDIEGK